MLNKIRERWAKATPGPWMWDINIACKAAHLETKHSGRIYVMGFRRWGMQGAQPVFQADGLVESVKKFAVPRQKHHPDFDMDIDHPDAQAIASAPSDIAYLLAQIERLQAENEGLKCCGNCYRYIEQNGDCQGMHDISDKCKDWEMMSK